MGDFQAHEIFTDISSKFQGFVLDFYHFHERRRLQDIRLLAAPFFQSFGHRIYVVKQWIQEGALHVGEGTDLREELRAIREDDLQQNPERTFGGANALGYAVSAFDVSDYSPPSIKRGAPSKALPLGAWT